MTDDNLIRHCGNRKRGCISDCEDQKDFLGNIRDVYKTGELLVYPTETLYALGCNPFLDKALDRLYQVKRRPKDMPISIAVSDLKMMEEIAQVNEPAKNIYENFLPGPVTLILEKREHFPIRLTGGTGKIGIRVPNHPLALKIIEIVGPITATSANLHGHANPRTVDDAFQQLGEDVSLYLDCGECKYKEASTVVDVTDSSIKIIRKGAIPQKELEACLIR
jgi:L-threonylcarbamoyladenylate synthase